MSINERMFLDIKKGNLDDKSAVKIKNIQVFK